LTPLLRRSIAAEVGIFSGKIWGIGQEEVDAGLTVPWQRKTVGLVYVQVCGKAMYGAQLHLGQKAGDRVGVKAPHIA